MNNGEKGRLGNEEGLNVGSFPNNLQSRNKSIGQCNSDTICFRNIKLLVALRDSREAR